MSFNAGTYGSYRRRQLTYRERKKLLPFVFAIIAGILAMNLLGSLSYQVSALRLSFSAKFAWPGITSLSIPPIGNINAATHWLPVQIKVALENIDLDILRSIILANEQGAGEAVVNAIYSEGQRILFFFCLKLVLIAGLGSAFGVILLRQTSLRQIISGFFIGVLLTTALLGGIYLTYDLNAFNHPEYEGIVEAAPWMINLIQESILKVDQLGEQVQALATNLYGAFQQIENLTTIGSLDADLTVLHVSDIHNNPIAYDFARQVVASFPVDFIIDTGDLTDWGTALEAEIVNRIADLDVKYVFVSGNHESPDVLQRLQELEQVIIIDDHERTVHGLRIAGVGDLSADDYSPQVVPLTDLADLAKAINQHYQAVLDPPDIFLVHNHRVAAAIEPNIFPVVLFGHNHRQSINIVENTVYVNAGTTGAAGIRGLQSKEPTPFSLALLHFALDESTNKYSLIAVDGINVQGLSSSFSLERIFINSDRRNNIDDVETINEIQ